MFDQWKKKPAKTTPASEGEKDQIKSTPINGIAGGSSKVKASRKKIVWGGLAVLVVAILIANKVVVHHDSASEIHDVSGSSAALPSMNVKKTSALPNKAAYPLPAAPANGALMAMKPTSPQAPVTSGSPVSVQVIQSILSRDSNNTATVVQVWPGPGHLEGVIYKDVNGNEGVVWVNVPDSLVLIGTLIGQDGKNYNDAADFSMATGQQGTQPTAQTVSGTSNSGASSVTPTNALMELKTRGDGFVVGASGPEITAYIDPNSETSHRLYDALQSAVNDGKVKARYVLVALKNKSSLTKAEQILSAPSPAKVLSTDERLGKKDARNTWSGGIKGVQGSLYMTQDVNMNTALLASAGYIGDPVVIWCNKAGKAQVATNDGAVGDLSAILNAAGTCH